MDILGRGPGLFGSFGSEPPEPQAAQASTSPARAGTTPLRAHVVFMPPAPFESVLSRPATHRLELRLPRGLRSLAGRVSWRRSDGAGAGGAEAWLGSAARAPGVRRRSLVAEIWPLWRRQRR